MNAVPSLNIEALRAFQDNYIWLLTRPGSALACVVDPGDAAPVQAVLQERQLTLDSILLTHHHADHTGGVADLLKDSPAQVYGPAESRIQNISHALRAGDDIRVLGCQFTVMEVPGHTLDHIAFFAPAQPQAGLRTPLLFCGDTLFAAGCGRLFEGTAEVMYASLQSLARLPRETLIYCAHEYTMANLRFARAAEPDNQDLAERQVTDEQRLEEARITLPSSIDVELRTNPFLRCHNHDLQKRLARQTSDPLHSEVDVFAALRRWKDEFR